MSSVSQKIAQNLLHVGAVKVRMNPPFQWVSGILSPVYCDNRMLISFPRERQEIVDAFCALLKEKGYDKDVCIAGTATAAIPWAAFIAQVLGLPMCYIRPEPKGHGAGKQIEGAIPAGSRVVIIEDLISTGGSSVKAAQAVERESGIKVSDIFAIVSWELAASAKIFTDVAIQLTTLTGFTAIMEEAVGRGVITPEQMQKIQSFKQDPSTWATREGISL